MNKIQDPWETIKSPDLQIMYIGQEKRAKGRDNVFKKVMGKFPNLVNEAAIRCRWHLENQINMIKKEYATSYSA